MTTNPSESARHATANSVMGSTGLNAPGQFSTMRSTSTQ